MAKQKRLRVKSYKTVKGRQLYFIKSKKKVSCCFDSRLRFFPYKSDDPRNKSCSIKYKYNLADIKKAETTVSNEKNKKSKVWNWLFLAFNICLVAGIFIYQFATGDAVSIIDLFSLDASWNFLSYAVLIVFAETILETTKTFILIYISTHRIRPFLSYKSTALCRYYDSISPMSTAGEPFQIYYLKRRGLRGEVAASIPIVKSLFWQLGNTILSVCLLVFNAKAYIASNPLVVTIAWISVAANFVILSTIFLLSISKRFGQKIVIGILKLLAKLHIIKNYQLTFRKVVRFVINYQNCMRTFAKNIFVFILEILLAIGGIVVMAIVPYFIYRTFLPAGEIPIPLIDVITKVIICNMVSNIIPIPGGSGAAEFSFMAMFASLFSDGTLVWAMLIWRILTYYQLILQGLGVTIYDTVYGNKKADKLVQSGYFNEKIHFSMIHRKQKKMDKKNKKNKIEEN